MRSSILYLDYDGVLHADEVYRESRRRIIIRNGELFGWAHFLEEALEPHPSVRIVLSTSWVRVVGFDKAKAYLTPALAERVVGATFHRRVHGPTRELRSHWAESLRGQQIACDLTRRSPSAWLALDDAVEQFTHEQRGWLVPCDSKLGLSDARTRTALNEALCRIGTSLAQPQGRGT